MNMDSTEIARLRELKAKAIPGPWEVRELPADCAFCEKSGVTRYGIFPVGAEYESDAVAVAGHDAQIPSRVDSAYIVAMENALPGLLDELEALAEARDIARIDRDVAQASAENYQTHNEQLREQLALARKALESLARGPNPRYCYCDEVARQALAALDKEPK